MTADLSLGTDSKGAERRFAVIARFRKEPRQSSLPRVAHTKIPGTEVRDPYSARSMGTARACYYFISNRAYFISTFRAAFPARRMYTPDCGRERTAEPSMLRVSRTERPSMSDTRTTAPRATPETGTRWPVTETPKTGIAAATGRAAVFFTNVAVSAVSFAPIVTVRLADVSPSLHLLNA